MIVQKQFYRYTFLLRQRVRRFAYADARFIFCLTFDPNNLIYESHCDPRIANLMFRENRSMKYATKKAAKKKATKKKAPAKKKVVKKKAPAKKKATKKKAVKKAAKKKATKKR